MSEYGQGIVCCIFVIFVGAFLILVACGIYCSIAKRLTQWLDQTVQHVVERNLAAWSDNLANRIAREKAKGK